ncbi:unnamed protein product [Fusarium venenatum]|uniref:Uncharacterized protein n=1 Tax=Fusarium venenatum TaxID=56646 RepID=A0A2L2U0U2_9HYPO|nr:uncharacterized protein FVRRES_08737 [Fusarium venenatum]CEI68660.1 unnamed protein product [Fusarium venenatum]
MIGQGLIPDETDRVSTGDHFGRMTLFELKERIQAFYLTNNVFPRHSATIQDKNVELLVAEYCLINTN